MRTRWQEWVIILALVAIGATGVLAIWGKDLRRLFHGEEEKDMPQPAEPAPGSASERF